MSNYFIRERPDTDVTCIVVDVVRDTRIVSLSFRVDGDGIEIVDPVERTRTRLAVGCEAALTRTTPEQLLFPVDVAVRFRADRLALDSVVPLTVRTADGTTLATVDQFADEAFPAGEYVLEVSAPIKLYVEVESGIEIRSDFEGTTVAFEEPTDCLLGARSKHDSPAGTITTTDDPADAMATIEAFASALKATSPERSYPTLRGHPPTVELGEGLSIPDRFEPPETGISLELPPSFEYLYPAASLAYYLGASIEPASRPALVADGTRVDLGTGTSYEDRVGELLQQTFFLDCVVRTEGLYEVDLHERAAVEDELPFDVPAMYDRPIPEQVAAYVSVPFETVRPHLPDWKLTAHVSPDPDSIETLPFVVDDLAVVRTPSPTDASGPIPAPAVGTDGGFTRRADAAPTPPDSFVRPDSESSIEQTWIGEETPIGASKSVAEAYRNRLDRSPTAGAIDITVVCNDDRMSAEHDLAGEVYGSREELPFDVTVRRELTTEALRETLTEPTDFLHYIGHIDDGGFDCADGKLDTATIEDVGVDAFFLNACQSYEQGLNLIRAGAIGGIVTVNDVLNTGAVDIGRAVARLLNAGFPLRAALDIARDESVVGIQYLVLGDGSLSVVQAEDNTPKLFEISRTGDEFELEFKTIASHAGIGGLVTPYLKEYNKYYLNSGTIDTFEVSKDELEHFLTLEDVPIKVDGKLHWSYDLEVGEI